MTIQEKDFKPNTQVRKELIEFAQGLIDSNSMRDDEHLSYVSVGTIYRNQGLRNCVVTGRITNQSYIKCKAEKKLYKDAYVTYVMPSGKVCKAAIDSVREYLNGTLKLVHSDITDMISMPD